MNLSDIITLAKNGYKPADIKELIELSKEVTPEVVYQGEALEDDCKSDNTTPEVSKPTEAIESEPSIDYKKMYEEEHTKLLNAQKVNLSQNMAGSVKSDEENLCEIFKNLK